MVAESRLETAVSSAARLAAGNVALVAPVPGSSAATGRSWSELRRIEFLGPHGVRQFKPFDDRQRARDRVIVGVQAYLRAQYVCILFSVELLALTQQADDFVVRF